MQRKNRHDRSTGHKRPGIPEYTGFLDTGVIPTLTTPPASTRRLSSGPSLHAYSPCMEGSPERAHSLQGRARLGGLRQDSVRDTAGVFCPSEPPWAPVHGAAVRAATIPRALSYGF